MKAKPEIDPRFWEWLEKAGRAAKLPPARRLAYQEAADLFNAAARAARAVATGLRSDAAFAFGGAPSNHLVKLQRALDSSLRVALRGEEHHPRLAVMQVGLSIVDVLPPTDEELTVGADDADVYESARRMELGPWIERFCPVSRWSTKGERYDVLADHLKRVGALYRKSLGPSPKSNRPRKYEFYGELERGAKADGVDRAELARMMAEAGMLATERIARADLMPSPTELDPGGQAAPEKWEDREQWLKTLPPKYRNEAAFTQAREAWVKRTAAAHAKRFKLAARPERRKK